MAIFNLEVKKIILTALILICLVFSYTDIKARRIPNNMIHPLLIIAFLIRLMDIQFYLGLIPAVIFTVLFLVNSNAIGAGDIKLIALIGLILGINSTVIVLAGMSLSALTYLIYRYLKDKLSVKTIPLAPFLTIGVLCAVYIF